MFVRGEHHSVLLIRRTETILVDGQEDNVQMRSIPGDLLLQSVQVAELATTIRSRGMHEIPPGDFLHVISGGYNL